MAKNPKNTKGMNFTDAKPNAKPLPDDAPQPTPPALYPGAERFGDWSLDNIIPLEPGEILVNDDPEGDPYKFAHHGEPDQVPRKKK